MDSREVHEAAARAGMAEAKRAVWAEDDDGVVHCLERMSAEGALAGVRKVLDYGCGMGRLLKPMMLAGTAELVGYDPAPTMLERAREHLDDGGGALVKLTDDRSTLDGERFDLAYCVCVLQHLEWPQQADALRWLAMHADLVVVQFVTYPADVGDLSHPVAEWTVVADLMPPRSHLRHLSLTDDPRFPTWRWVTARYR